LHPSLEGVFKDKSSAAMLEELSIRIYEQPLLALREQLPDLPAAIRVPILVIDFDTALNMEGILGFLENSTGLYLRETIEALHDIGAHETVNIMTKISEIMAKHNVSVADLRADFKSTELYEVTSFRKLHGEKCDEMTDEILAESEKFYLYSDTGEDVLGFLTNFIERNATELLTIIHSTGNNHAG
jgi:Domain of unknown function (DUF4375)